MKMWRANHLHWHWKIFPQKVHGTIHENSLVEKIDFHCITDNMKYSWCSYLYHLYKQETIKWGNSLIVFLTVRLINDYRSIVYNFLSLKDHILRVYTYVYCAAYQCQHTLLQTHFFFVFHLLRLSGAAS